MVKTKWGKKIWVAKAGKFPIEEGQVGKYEEEEGKSRQYSEHKLAVERKVKK